MRSSLHVIFVAIVILLAIATIGAIAWVGKGTATGGLLPVLPTPTVPADTAINAPVLVTFPELNADPLAYLDKAIQVSGAFIGLDSATCPRYTGPDIRWALVSEELQLDAKGYDRIVQLVEPGTDLVVQGIWRLYQGPIGCGKGPPANSSWYLQVQKIIEPNPLISSGLPGTVNIEHIVQEPPSLLPTTTPAVASTFTQSELSEMPTLSSTNDQFFLTATSEVIGTPVSTLTPIITVTQSTGATPGTPIPIETSSGLTSTPIATPTPDSGGGSNGNTLATETPLPPISTEDSGGEGYPGQATATPTFTPTIDPYP